MQSGNQENHSGSSKRNKKGVPNQNQVSGASKSKSNTMRTVALGKLLAEKVSQRDVYSVLFFHWYCCAGHIRNAYLISVTSVSFFIRIYLTECTALCLEENAFAIHLCNIFDCQP